MRATKRAARLAAGLVLVLGAMCVSAPAASAADDGDELVDVTKTVTELEKKMDELHARGRAARRGELSAAAVCRNDAPDDVFATWGDEASYVPAPEGDLEDPGAWSLNKHAGRAENSPFSTGESSLFLLEHGEAVSPAMCITQAHPTIRMFAANTGDPDAELEVEILYEDLDGKLKRLKVAELRGDAGWRPTRIVPLHVNLLGAAFDDGVTAIAVKLKAHGMKRKDAGWKVDDLYVDPLKTW